MSEHSPIKLGTIHNNYKKRQLPTRHGQPTSPLGNGTIKGLSVAVASGETTFTLRNNNTVLIEGNAELTTKDGDINTDRAPCTFMLLDAMKLMED